MNTHVHTRAHTQIEFLKLFLSLVRTLDNSNGNTVCNGPDDVPFKGKCGREGSLEEEDGLRGNRKCGWDMLSLRYLSAIKVTMPTVCGYCE